MTRPEKELERGMIRGIALACSIFQSGFDQPTMVAHVIAACGLDRRRMKRAGVDDYDLKVLRKVFAELRVLNG